MKKFSVIALVCALAMMLTVPFGAFADEPAFALVVDDVTGKVGDEVVVDIAFTMAEGVYVMNGDLTIHYPADELDLVIPPKTGLADPVNKLCTLPVGYVEVMAFEDKGEINIAFADQTAEGLANMVDKVIAKLPFVIKAEGDHSIKVETKTLMRTEDGITGIDVLEELGTPDAPGKIEADAVIEAKPAATTTTTTTTTTKATTTTTKATTTTTKATTTTTTTKATTAATTKAPTPAGEATPWALLATVSVAGAALVVLSTKKSK